jgi:tRNA(fMet)-specific endonuclease VapC
MNGSLLDTNIIIKLLNGNPETVDLFHSLEQIFISSITVGELIYGAMKSTRKKENIELFNSFLHEYPILGVDAKTAHVYGEIKLQLVHAGINIPENDLWIASVALQHQLSLVTLDKHFSKINGLTLT